MILMLRKTCLCIGCFLYHNSFKEHDFCSLQIKKNKHLNIEITAHAQMHIACNCLYNAIKV